MCGPRSTLLLPRASEDTSRLFLRDHSREFAIHLHLRVSAPCVTTDRRSFEDQFVKELSLSLKTRGLSVSMARSLRAYFISLYYYHNYQKLHDKIWNVSPISITFVAHILLSFAFLRCHKHGTRDKQRIRSRIYRTIVYRTDNIR